MGLPPDLRVNCTKNAPETLAEIEKLMPATFSAMEKKQVTDFFEHMGTPARIKEALLAKERGARLISLGKRILRCETAAAVALALVQYERGQLGA